MESWGECTKEAAARRFRMQLEERALKRLLANKGELAALRHDWDALRSRKKVLANALREWRVDLDKEVLKASSPCWDAEDEQKYASSKELPPRGVPLYQEVDDDPSSSGDPPPSPAGSSDGSVRLVGVRELPDLAVPVSDPDGVSESLLAVRAKRLLRFGG